MRIVGITLSIIIILFSNTYLWAESTRPKALKAVAGDGVVYLSWHKSKKDVKGYWVYRAVPDGDYQKENSILLTENFYKDTDVVNGQSYWYTVTAIDKEDNESVQSKDVTATPNVHEKPLSGY